MLIEATEAGILVLFLILGGSPQSFTIQSDANHRFSLMPFMVLEKSPSIPSLLNALLLLFYQETLQILSKFFFFFVDQL